jgi:hypothetical protein
MRSGQRLLRLLRARCNFSLQRKNLIVIPVC